MAERPWLTIIGLGEDGPDGLSPASLAALHSAEIIVAPPRHLALLPDGPWKTLEWPVPFADGIPKLLGLRGQSVVVLVSGDPFWFGAGGVLARHLERGEWQALPAPSVFSHVAARMGWALENTICLGLHAAPLSRLRPHLAENAQIIVLLRDGAAVHDLAAYLLELGCDSSIMTVCEALAGERERITTISPRDAQAHSFNHPVSVALKVSAPASPVTVASGLDDAFFEHDGQITKRPVRALTLSALAPRSGEYLWDIGGGSGSIALEWLLAHPSLRATTIERDPQRAARIGKNALRLGVDRLKVIQGEAPQILETLDPPNAVFVGGGLSQNMLEFLTKLAPGTRIVANAVTLEAEALLTDAHTRLGGDLMRVEIAHAKPLGTKQGWQANYPIVQWKVIL